MLNVTLDFRHIRNTADFYRQFAARCQLSTTFGANLDALWDSVTGEMALPARIRLRHLSQHADSAQFAAIIATLQQAEEALAGELQLTIEP
ncbi:ribonuclease inhibitor [Erwinia toletana]|uniref:Ribonuclease inhibitor n=1 Tax=Winslowiella toletana TaxID=92490 RepID=A0ABS4PH91_9GAMM|nr:barstar family protein [Winslowiella toletana]MBP2171476.1 ribonuclease inhibitor [Winslowiella toletana]